jgi:hypothetical protein
VMSETIASTSYIQCVTWNSHEGQRRREGILRVAIPFGIIQMPEAPPFRGAVRAVPAPIPSHGQGNHHLTKTRTVFCTDPIKKMTHGHQGQLFVDPRRAADV